MSHSVRTYRGETIPWKVHDCTESNSCTFCRAQKRKFVEEWKKKNPRPMNEPNTKNPDTRRADFDLCVMDRGTGRKGVIGAGWKNEDGSVSVILNPCVVWDSRDNLTVRLFPRTEGR